MSVVEVALKADKLGGVTRADCEEAVKGLNLTTLPFTAAYALRLFELPKHHNDPFDRMLIATALAEDIPIVSGDGVFNKYQDLRVIW